MRDEIINFKTDKFKCLNDVKSAFEIFSEINYLPSTQSHASAL